MLANLLNQVSSSFAIESTYHAVGSGELRMLKNKNKVDPILLSREDAANFTAGFLSGKTKKAFKIEKALLGDDDDPDDNGCYVDDPSVTGLLQNAFKHYIDEDNWDLGNRKMNRWIKTLKKSINHCPKRPVKAQFRKARNEVKLFTKQSGYK